MWRVDEFMSLVKAEEDTFGQMLGDRADDLVVLVDEDESVKGFLVYVGRDPFCGLHVLWTLAALTDRSLLMLRSDPLDHLCSADRLTADMCQTIEVTHEQRRQLRSEDERIRHLRGFDVRLLTDDGLSLSLSGSEWAGGWSHTTTGLAIDGATGFFTHVAEVLGREAREGGRPWR